MSRVKTIITTDMEVDDMNSLIHLCLYLNDIDVLGIVYTSSQYHFIGDGVHALGEITPNYRCSGPAGLVRPRVHQGPDPQAKDCRDFRPFRLGWIESLWRNEYAKAYEYLIKHDKRYPSPQHLLEITKIGNVEFEGDVRFDTEGSNMIRDILLQDNDDVIYLQSWGGVNTIVRALLSIHERFGNTDEWSAVRDRVTSKIRLLGVINYVGQDNSYLDNRINEIYPDIQILRPEFLYGGYTFSKTVQEDCRDMFTSKWMYENIHTGNGELMEAYRLMGDGKPIEGEAEVYQFGLRPVLDFGKPGVPPVEYDKYEFLAEGDSNTYIGLLDFGFRGLKMPNCGTIMGRLTDSRNQLKHGSRDILINPFLRAYQQDWAARAKWCVSEYEEANHAPLVEMMTTDVHGKPGEMVELLCRVSDPDSDQISLSWEHYYNFSTYSGNESIPEIIGNEEKAAFRIPSDARHGEVFTLTLRAIDDGNIPMSSFGQCVVHVE
ncbi:MAG: DUF1593 domain-containing protein [Erysipelotrichaceae bacterium]|nr:DUF1593 domain-containing protein [Erysipelotrichaceae bacterium]